MKYASKLLDLITTPDGRLSHTKLWSNAGCATATWVIIWYAVKLDLTWDMFALYLGTIAGANVAGKFLDLKHGNKPAEAKK